MKLLSEILSRPRTRLQQGMIVDYYGTECRVERVNYSRAHLVPVKKKRVIYQNKVTGQTRDFMAKQRGFDIAPDSEIRIIRR